MVAAKVPTRWRGQAIVTSYSEKQRAGSQSNLENCSGLVMVVVV
jgi:hypothetical protein